MRQMLLLPICAAMLVAAADWLPVPGAWGGAGMTAAAEAQKPPVTESAASANADRVIDRMRPLRQKPQALIDEFQAEDIAAWPPEIAAKAGEAFYLRGQAYAGLKDGKKAEADLKMAVERAPRNTLFWIGLAENYNGTLKDEQRALDAYRRTLELAGVTTNWLGLSATLSAATILRNQARYDEALQVLGRYKDLDAISTNWRVRMLRAYAHIYAGQGREVEALDKFNEALRLEDGKYSPGTEDRTHHAPRDAVSSRGA